MIKSTPLAREVSREQAKFEVFMCLMEEPDLTTEELAERLIIDYSVIEEIVGKIRK